MITNTINRLQHTFQAKSTNKLTIYFTAGYPRLDSTVEVIKELDKNEVDIIEVGMPYSDPLADGPTIQKSSTVALKNGMSLDLLFDQISEARKHSQIPIVLMGYYNQVLQYGVEKFSKQAATAGVDGLILPDLPLPEYHQVCKSTFDEYGLCCSFLVTPSSSDERIKELDNASSGFLYAISNHGTTGGELTTALTDYSSRLKNLDLSNPVQLGFGVSDHESYKRASQFADGVIIGSAFIKAISKSGSLPEQIHSFIHEIKHGKK